MYLFDPLQLKEFGSLYYEDSVNGFSYRYQKGRRFGGIFNSIYIPYGPICKTEGSFLAFLNHLDEKKRTRIIINLPLIMDNGLKNVVNKELQKRKYKKKPYLILDSETIIIKKSEYKPNSRTRRYIRRGKKDFIIEIKEKLRNDELEEIYKIYKNTSSIQNFVPKPIQAFQAIMKNGLVSIARNKKNNNTEGFLMAYASEIPIRSKKTNNILSLIFTAISDYGRENKVGFVLHGELFEKAINGYGMDLLDFHGADRSRKDRKYLAFKQKWGGKFYELGGGYERFRW